MSVTYGFYNSFNGDRRYNAEQFGSIFDGVIEDGVYQGVRKNANTAPFAVTPNGTNSVNVDVGRAWLNHTWTYNDANVAVELSTGDDVYDRTDAIVIDVDLIARENKIIAVQGDISRADRKPVLTRDTVNDHYQYLIAYLYRPRASTSVDESQITYLVSAVADDDPNIQAKLKWVTAPVQSVDITSYYTQWEAAWEEYYNTMTESFNTWQSDQQTDFDQWLRNANASIPSGSTANLITRLEALENVLGGIESADGYSYKDALTDAGGSNLYDNTGAVLDGRVVFIMAGEE